jgi:threonyl-tRNA synthetase
MAKESQMRAGASVDTDLYTMRHSAAHLMAAAIQRIWPAAKFGVGPPISNGFYYDVLFEERISSPSPTR